MADVATRQRREERLPGDRGGPARLGGADGQHGRRILDWPADVSALADALGLGRFGVLGYSGGVPYALACAQLLPERVTAAGLVGCVGPDETDGLVAGLDPVVAKNRRTSRTHPWLARATWAGVRMATRRYPQRVLAQTAAALPEPDRRALADPRMASAYLAALREALRPGAAGAAQDMALMASPWRLSPEQIQIPVVLWQGELDRNAPPVMARHLTNLIPDCTTHWFPGDGHLSIVTNHGPAILAGLHQPERSSHARCTRSGTPNGRPGPRPLHADLPLSARSCGVDLSGGGGQDFEGAVVLPMDADVSDPEHERRCDQREQAPDKPSSRNAATGSENPNRPIVHILRRPDGVLAAQRRLAPWRPARAHISVSGSSASAALRAGRAPMPRSGSSGLPRSGSSASAAERLIAPAALRAGRATLPRSGSSASAAERLVRSLVESLGCR